VAFPVSYLARRGPQDLGRVTAVSGRIRET